jgi:hypothetical protein
MAEEKKGILETMNEACVRAYLEKTLAEYPDNGSRKYEESIVSLIDDNAWEKDVIKGILEELVNNQAEEPELAYAAFYGLCTFYRRHKYKSDYNDMILQGEKKFKDRASYPFLKLMCDKMKRPEDWDLLDKARELCTSPGLNENYGVKHCFAEYVAGACEYDPGRIDHWMEAYMPDAKAMVDIAINCDKEYAKFYVTRARLRNIEAIHKHSESIFRESQQDIERAINKEKKVDKRAEYRVIGTQLKSEFYEKSLLHKIEKQEEDIKQQFHENSVKNLEFLSFFSAVIGLLIAGVQTTMNMNFRQASTLLVALSGCLITAFGAVGFVLHNKKTRWIVNAVIVIIGLVLVALAMMYGEKNVL